MIRIHLAQIVFKPAYYDAPYDFLEEPSFLSETDSPLGKLRHIDQVEDFLIDCKSVYIEHIRSKVRDIVAWSGKRKANILVFPEYSIPTQLLSDLQQLAKTHSMVIVGGTHRVPSGNDAADIYKQLLILPNSVPLGSACAPVFLPDGSVRVSLKSKKSKWEPNLSTPDRGPGRWEIAHNESQLMISIVPCIDSLHPEILGKLWENGKGPDVVICPSLSPAVEPFDHPGAMSLLKGVLFAFVNSASYGGTRFNIPNDWAPYLTGHPGPFQRFPVGIEGVMELDFDPTLLFRRTGSTEPAPMCRHPFTFPIVYPKSMPWINTFFEFRKDLLEWLLKGDQGMAIDWTDSYLAENAGSLPELVSINLKHLRHALLSLYDGDIESAKMTTSIIPMSNNLEETARLWASASDRALKTLTEHLRQSPGEVEDDVVACLRTVKRLRRELPAMVEHEEPEIAREGLTNESTLTFTGEESLIEAFQNRGHDLDQIRNVLSNPSNQVIIVTGPIGIGKSDFINWMFKKTFTDWEPVRIPVVQNSHFPRIVAEIGYRVGVPLDIDSLASCSQNVFRQKIRNVLKRFFGMPKRVLIVDDLNAMLRAGNGRDHNQLAIFIQEATAEHALGGRICLVSSQWLPDKWLHLPGVAHLRLTGLIELYIRRIVEFHMRKLGMIEGESIPEIPQSLLDIIKGHPLSARLVAEALRDKGLKELSDDMRLQKITGQVAKELLRRVELDPDENELMQKLAFFRLPIRVHLLQKIQEFQLQEGQVNGLIRRCMVSFDGNCVEMHEAVRRFYAGQIESLELRTKLHRLAASYYRRLYDEQRLKKISDPNVMAELIHHLSLAGEISETEDLKLLIVDEIKPTARKVYREDRRYQAALALFRLIANVRPDDPEVLAYMGRCYGRLGQWEECDSFFEKAIDTASKLGHPTWWLYRDWGHIRARYGFYNEAKTYLDKAKVMRPKDPSIKATLAYMYWHQGNTPLAETLFEEALAIDPGHAYTLIYYSKLLDIIEKHEYAEELRRRLAETEDTDKYRMPNEYDVDMEYDD